MIDNVLWQSVLYSATYATAGIIAWHDRKRRTFRVRHRHWRGAIVRAVAARYAGAPHVIVEMHRRAVREVRA